MVGRASCRIVDSNNLHIQYEYIRYIVLGLDTILNYSDMVALTRAIAYYLQSKKKRRAVRNGEAKKNSRTLTAHGHWSFGAAVSINVTSLMYQSSSALTGY